MTPPNLTFILAIGSLYNVSALSVINMKILNNGTISLGKKADKDVNFKRKYSILNSFNTAEEAEVIIKVDDSVLEPRITNPYARSFTPSESESLSGLFVDQNQESIFIYKQIIGQSKKFMFSTESIGPENYERPKDFEDGDFQMMKLLTTPSNELSEKPLVAISLCQYDTSFQFRADGACGKKWTVKHSFFMHDAPAPGLTPIYIGSRNTKPWDSRVSLTSLDDTSFVKNQFVLYVPVNEKVEVKVDDNEQDDYTKMYHFVGWSTRYSSKNITHHYYSTTKSAPEGYIEAESGAKTVHSIQFPKNREGSDGLDELFVCAKKEKKNAREEVEGGAGVKINEERALSESPCSNSYDYIESFFAWHKQQDAPREAVEVYVTKKRSWPFDTLLSFTHMNKNNDFKPAFSFWTIPATDNRFEFMTNSGLVISGIKNDRMTIEWRKDQFVKTYKVEVVPQPSKVTEFETKSNRLTLKGLNADTQYEITITPMTSGVSLEPMIAKQKTAPSPPRLLFPVIRSTSMEILIGQIEGAEDYRLKIDPEVEEIPSSSSHLTVRVEPETEYTISLIVVISKARDIQTSEITRIIKTSPNPDRLTIDIQAERDGKIAVKFEGLETVAEGYRFKMESDDDLPMLRRDQFLKTNSFKMDEPNGKNEITMSVAASLGGSLEEKRETDFITIKTPFRRCHWVAPDKRLSCTGNEGMKSTTLSWAINKDGMVEVETHANPHTTISRTDVEVLNIDNNLLDGLELKRFVSQFPNLQRLNASNNEIVELKEDTFSRNLKIWKIVLSENKIKQFPVNLFRYTQGLQILDVSFNPIEYCGLGHAHLQTLETKLRKLDVRGTNFPENLLGHWNALMLYYDVGNAPNFIHQSIYPQLCPIKIT